MTRFAKIHPAIRNERGCPIDRLMLAIIIFTLTTSMALTAILLTP